MAEEIFIIVPKARPAVDFASNLLVIPKDDFDEYVKEIDRHHIEFVRSLELSWDVTADDRAREAVKMAKEHYEKIIAEKECHHKYKRCLAMAEWCDAEAALALADGDYEDMRWFQKWHERWLELAEKFKEAK